jgi:hypothetical protein
MRLEEMKRPRVERLGYHVHVAPEVEFDTPPPLEFETPEFYWKRSGDTLSLIPKVRFTTERDARVAVEPLLKTWEVQAGIDAGGPVFSFEFGTMRFIDEANNSPSGYGLDHRTARLGIAMHYSEYPSPPSAVTITPDIETLWSRYSIDKQGGEPL